MEVFATDLEKLAFLLEVDAELAVDEELHSQAAASGPDGPVSPEDRPKYITNYIGSKQKLVDWIWKHTPDSVDSVVDAFSGSSVVAYMYKSKGLRVLANDRLRYSYHAARAIVENSNAKLTDEEIETLLEDNAKAGNFVQDNFKGLFFGKGVHAIIDSVRANCDKLSGFKKDIALFGLGKTCASGGFGHFTSSTQTGMRMATPEKFRNSLKANYNRINALVFDNGKENKAFQKDVNELLPNVDARLAYFDPPYATEFSTTNYEKAYHFVEGLMTYWEGKKILEDSKTKAYETDHKTVSKGNAEEFFRAFLSNASKIPHWLISYRDHAYPNEQQMRKIIADNGRTSSMKSKSHLYTITAKRGAASSAQERLFICQKAEGASTSSSTEQMPMDAQANFHTSFPVSLSAKGGLLSTEALDTATPVDPQFSFILCRTGTNKNGDHFTAEELSSRHMTAINKKVDLQHSQEFSDIVGGISAAEYREDENGGRVECVGELFTNESDHARLAYKLMKRGIISQVSMECDYVEGECSVCGKRFKSKADYCPHLRKYKGGELNGKQVFEILHGVTFTGLGLLDRKGADENARILQVASRNPETPENNKQGDPSMDDNHDNSGEQTTDAAKKGKEPAGGGAATPPQDSDLKKENQQLKAQVQELQKRVKELEAQQKAAASKARAEKLLEKIEKQGVRFASEDERQNEFSRLTALSDEAFAATEAAYSRMPATVDGKKDEGHDKGNGRTQAAEKPNRTEASMRPRDVDDGKASLEDRLKNGMLAAYRNRIGSDHDNNGNQ